MIKRFLAFLICLALTVMTAVPAFAEKGPAVSAGASFTQVLKDPDGRTLGVSFRGDTKNYPENTVEGILSAAGKGADAVLVNVSKTADGVLILFADADTKRMIASDEVFTVAQTQWSRLSSLALKDAEGGVYGATQYRIPTLTGALSAAKENGVALVLSAPAELLPGISEALTETDTLELCAVTLCDTAENIAANLEKCENKPVIMGEIRNNIIFKVTSYEKAIENLGGTAVTLRTTNRYGVNYYKTNLAKLSGRLRAAADLSDKQTAGNRSDCEKWWDDLISRGYSVIITRETELFADYLTRTDKAKALLKEELSAAESFPLPDFKKEFLNDFVKAYNDAVANAKKLTADDAAALRDLSDAYADLVKAVGDINLNYDGLEDGSAELNVTPASVFLCFFAVALVMAAQIYVFRKRKKQ